MARLIDADALLDAISAETPIHTKSFIRILDLITNAPTVQRDGWVRIGDRLPNPNTRVLVLRDAGINIKNPKHIGYPNKQWVEISSLSENNFFLCDIVDTGITICWQPLLSALTDKE